jgi:lipopolysaccharide/colanic/teichoic acid biosynthesis glycosyltransferase
MKCLFDVAMALLAAVFLALLSMPKVRSMRIDTPAVATHLLQNPDQWLTPIGYFLRKSSYFG